MVADDVRAIPTMALSHAEPNVEEALRSEVLSKAQKKFGYQSELVTKDGPLRAVLKELGLTVLDTDSVLQYKASKERTRTISGGMRSVAVWAMSMCVIALAVTAGIHFFHWDVVAYFALIPGIFVSFFPASVFEKDVVKKWSWETYQLGKSARFGETGYGRTYNHYTGYVPVHILNYCNEIHDKLPNVGFEIDELTLTIQRVPKPAPDPFIWAVLGPERYCIGVWDEREYEAKA